MAVTPTGWVGGVGGSLIIPPYWADFMRANLYPSLYFRQLLTKLMIPRGYGSSVRIPRWKSPFKVDSLGQTVLSGAKMTTAVYALTSSSTQEGTPSYLTARGLCAEFISGSTIQLLGVRAYSDKLI